MKHYYYLHTNGDLIHKSAIVVDSDPNYFDSSFVKKFWSIETEDRQTLYIFLIDAAAMGANPERVDQLKKLWGITDEDTLIFARRTGFRVYEEMGGRWCAETGDPKKSGFGSTPWDAMVELCREIKNE